VAAFRTHETLQWCGGGGKKERRAAPAPFTAAHAASQILDRAGFFGRPVMRGARVLFTGGTPYVTDTFQSEEIMKNIGAIVALIVAAAAPHSASAQTVAPQGAVACVSPIGVLDYSDAKESQNRENLRELLKGECRMFGGKTFTLLEEHNGIAKVLIFNKADDPETARVYYALGEILLE
jgi:hypothetical protein